LFRFHRAQERFPGCFFAFEDFFFGVGIDGIKFFLGGDIVGHHP
jgi:hypothetical protein